MGLRADRVRNTALQVAQRAQFFDRRPRSVEALRRLRRALPGDPGFGDPLSVAGTDGASTVARVADRLFDDQPRASREAGLGALQLLREVAAAIEPPILVSGGGW